METPHALAPVSPVSSVVGLGALAFESLNLRRLLAYDLDDSTIAMYQRDCQVYADYAYVEGFDWLAPDTLMTWRDHLVLESEMSPNTINRMLAAVKRVVKELAIRKLIEEQVSIQFDRISGVKLKRNRHRLKEHARTLITPEEMRQLCDAPDCTTLVGLRDAALLHTLASSGIRVSEAATLRLDQVKPRAGGYVLYVQGKTDIKPREALLSPTAYKAIKAWLTKRPVQSPYLFTGFTTRAAKATDKPISGVTVWNIVTRYATQCGLSYVKPHDFRRFVGTQIAKDGDIRKAQRILGHQRMETTARCYVLDELPVGATDHLY